MTLHVEDVCLERGGRRVVSDLSFEVREGEALVLRGANGSGKSTLIRALAGLGRIEAGRITLSRRGTPVDPSDHLAYAGHLDAIKPSMTVAENTRFWAGFLGSGAVEADTETALSTLALSTIAHQPAATCSAGQRRRLGLARLLLVPRLLWLLDEPTVSLDTGSAAAVSRLIGQHCENGGIAVVATHIDLGLPATQTLDLTAHARGRPAEVAADPFLSENLG